MGIMGGEGSDWLEVCIATYVDEEAGVLHSGLLAHLLHDFGLCVHFERGLWGFCVFRRVLKWCVEVWVV